MHYYQHHIGDFDRATRHLTRTERSVYLDLLFLYYESEQALPLDMATLCRRIVARSEEEKGAVLSVLDEFFHETPCGWFHDRCEEEIAEYQKNKSQASIAGKASAAARAERRASALGEFPTTAQRPLNGIPTTVERPLNDRATTVQRKSNDGPTTLQPTSNHEPVTMNHEPITGNLETEVQKQQQVKNLAPAVAVAAKKAEPKEEANPLNLLTWQAYKQAYTDRYSVPPIRDAATNAKIKSIVKGLGEEAPHVAAFFVFHNGSRYVAGMHQVGLLATDYAKLRTEWATNTRMTQSKAQQADKTATNFDAFAPLIAAARAKEEAERNQHA